MPLYVPEATVAYATPAVALGATATAGSADTAIRSNATIAAFDVTNPATQAFGDAAAVGAAAFAARRDHKHAMPANPVTAHEAAADPHPGYATDADLTAHAATPHGGGSHPDLAAHDTLGLATQAELDTHVSASNPHPGPTPGLQVGGQTIPGIFTNPAGTWLNWGSELVIPNPGVPVAIIVFLTGFMRNFSAMTSGVHRLISSFSGGTPDTPGQEVTIVCGQSAPTINRAAVANSHVRSGSPTGNIRIQAQCHSNHVSTGFEAGTLTYMMTPI